MLKSGGMDEQTQFGIALRRLREARGMTQEALAERAGLTRNAIAALERGRRQRPYPHTLRALAAALALSDEERVAFVDITQQQRNSAVSPGGAARALLPVPLTSLVGRERDA